MRLTSSRVAMPVSATDSQQTYECVHLTLDCLADAHAYTEIKIWISPSGRRVRTLCQWKLKGSKFWQSNIWESKRNWLVGRRRSPLGSCSEPFHLPTPAHMSPLQRQLSNIKGSQTRFHQHAPNNKKFCSSQSWGQWWPIFYRIRNQ